MNTIPFEIIGSEPITLEKGQGDEWIISGFPASEQEDFDKEVLERTGVIKGLDHFFRVGGWIDYDHQYPKTKDPKFLIGTATDRATDKDGRPIVIGKLFQHKELAKAIYADMGAGGKYGFSMWGQGVRDPKNPKRITHTLINLLTIAPMPKGYDQTLVKKGFPTGSMTSIAKALDMDWDLEKGEASEEDGSPVKCEGCGKTLNPVEMVMGKYPVCMKCVAKRHGEVVNPSSAKAPIKKSLGEQLSVAIAEHLEKAGATSKCNSCGKRVSVDRKMQSAGIAFGNAYDDICANCVRTHAENLDGVKHEARASATDVKRGYSPELQNRMTQNRDRMRASFTTDAYQRLGVQQPKGVTGRSTDTPIEKAMVAGDGIVEPGANIGASALKKQELKGVRTCKGCGKGITTTTVDFCTSCTKLGKKETGVTAVDKAILNHPSFLSQIAKR